MLSNIGSDLCLTSFQKKLQTDMTTKYHTAFHALKLHAAELFHCFYLFIFGGRGKIYTILEESMLLLSKGSIYSVKQSRISKQFAQTLVFFSGLLLVVCFIFS